MITRYLFIFSLFVCSLNLSSCGLFKDWDKTIREKGYNPRRDTTDFKPYEYVIIRNGFVPDHKQCPYADTLNVKLSIKGYEDSNYLPVKALQDSIQFVFSDDSIKEIVEGTMRLRLPSGGTWQRITTADVRNNKIQFGYRKDWRFRTVKPNYVIYFFCVRVKKDNKVFTIPSRHYYLTE